MGRDSRRKKGRRCKLCGRLGFATATELIEHVRECYRLVQLGLMRP